MNRYLDAQIVTGSTPGAIRYFKNVIYPEIEVTDQDIYIIASSNDRLDNLAADYYQDPSLWWLISSANNLPGNTIYVTNGLQIRIPADKTSALNKFIEVNRL